jgi:hypothetical protein
MEWARLVTINHEGKLDWETGTVVLVVLAVARDWS